MAGFSVNTNEHLIRSNLWSSQIKEVLDTKLQGLNWVDWITDFPDGDTINIPSIGQMEVLDYVEGEAVRYTAMDTGNFTFTINKYKSSATYITNKLKQDSYYMNRLVSSFVPKEARALAVAMEVDYLATGPAGQTLGNTNSINGAEHRWIGQGTGESMTLKDFAKANYSLNKANVPFNNRIAIVDPSVAYTLDTLTNIVNVSNNPMWEGVITQGLSDGMKFVKNIYGFDIYVSNLLKVNTASEQIGTPTASAGVNNLFFSAEASVLPIVGNVRQSPKVDSEYNKDLQREEYVTTCRYDFKLFRPENFLVVVTDTDVIV